MIIMCTALEREARERFADFIVKFPCCRNATPDQKERRRSLRRKQKAKS